MLILLPPSESKASPAGRGRAADLGRLSFPELTGTRQQLLAALATVSSRPDALAVLGVGAGLAAEVERNTRLPTLPAAPVAALYTGVLYDALGWSTLDAAARRRGHARLLVVSALWGALRFGDRVPPYRLSIGTDLPGVGNLAGLWRGVLDPALSAAAGRGVVVDCRSSSYAAAWRPTGPLAARTVAIRVLREQDGIRSVVSHMAKHTRGLVARRLLQSARAPSSVQAVAAELRAEWQVELVAPARPGRPWTADLLLTE